MNWLGQSTTELMVLWVDPLLLRRITMEVVMITHFTISKMNRASIRQQIMHTQVEECHLISELFFKVLTLKLSLFLVSVQFFFFKTKIIIPSNK
jgi:hypothetical protein